MPAHAEIVAVPNFAEPFGVYIHWPFCAAKCPYCDFNSHVRHGGWDEAAFLKGYLAELAETRARIGARRVKSIFFGGGTPSLMQATTVAALIDAVGKHWDLADGAEITLEANPGSVEADRFAGYRLAGVNRVSIGVQALNDTDLRALGRIHSVAEARRAIDIGQRTFDRVSFDLIYARPKQTEALWRAELAEALAMGVNHLSLYQLTIEPATAYEQLFKAGKLKIPEDAVADALYSATQELTNAAGLPVYEISNHARPGQESRHNLLYWRYGEYAGIGPGAHGRLIVDGVRRATSTEKGPEQWLARVQAGGHGRVEDEALTPAECADEALLMGLRLTEGLDLDRLATLASTRPSDASITTLIGHGMLERLGPSRIRATAHGRMVLNRVVLELAKGMASGA
jgi:putative oxygen-independent coproporphyrinogen III oxidase